jgi:hypothetical protein
VREVRERREEGGRRVWEGVPTTYEVSNYIVGMRVQQPTLGSRSHTNTMTSVFSKNRTRDQSPLSWLL